MPAITFETTFHEASKCPVIGDKITIVNASDRAWTRHRFVLAFGAYGEDMLMAYANSLDDALDECVDWIADHAPGWLADEQVAESYREAIEAGKTEDEAADEAMVDVTTAGNCGHHLLSWEWTVVAEDPDRSALASIISR